MHPQMLQVIARPLGAAIACLMALALSGCVAEPDLIEITITYDPWAYRSNLDDTEPGSAAEPQVARGEVLPLVAAHVRAVSLNANDLGLPVSQRSLAELEAADTRASGITDRAGTARVYAVGGGDFRLEVEPPVFDDAFEGLSELWAWRVLRQGGGLRIVPVPPPHGPPPGVLLEVSD